MMRLSAINNGLILTLALAAILTVFIGIASSWADFSLEAHLRKRDGSLFHGFRLNVYQGEVTADYTRYSYGEERIGQGRENARQFLKENPDIAEDLEAKVREHAGIPAPSAKDGGEDS